MHPENNQTSEVYVKSLNDYISTAWRRKFQILIPFFIVFPVTVLIVLMLPRVYLSSGTILIESQQIPEELIQSSVTSFAQERIQIIKQRILASAALTALIKKFDLYSEELNKTPRSEILADLRSRIIINVQSANIKNKRRRGASTLISFTISFEHESPSKAQKVANELVTLFLDENIKSRTARASETKEFLVKETNRLKGQINVMEEQIATYKQENEDSLPESLNINLKRAEEIKSLLFNTERELNQKIDEKKLLEIDLQNISNGNSVSSTEINTQSPSYQLKQLQNEFVNLSARYGDQHPDVKALKRKIKAYESEYGQLSNNSEIIAQVDEVRSEIEDLTRKYSKEHPDVKRLERKLNSLESMLKDSSSPAKKIDTSNNPDYLQVKSRLDSAQNNIIALGKSVLDLKAQTKKLDVAISRTPLVERGLNALQRDYHNVKNKYTEIKAKELQAELSKSLEEEQKGERFSLLEPPVLPDKPIKPNRPKLLALGFVLALMSGLGIAFIAETLDSGIRGISALAFVTKVQPMVAIPYIMTLQDDLKRKRNIKIALFAFIVLVFLFIFAIHTLYKPLDLIWFILLRKLNLS